VQYEYCYCEHRGINGNVDDYEFIHDEDEDWDYGDNDDGDDDADW
jgi:hypothetical protein